ncbi:U-box domain-containing protein 33 isoform X1 [Spinacia oleracea]|uniref:RING-type E3 ubiquitin transferase n=1 Tax=Spinacia oleracea TaxID=3562 RepID=A0A9R0I2L9_SPIOL|nr:U-box domain-containing protein 33-like isoform X1 [Spinacia oleracea]
MELLMPFPFPDPTVDRCSRFSSSSSSFSMASYGAELERQASRAELNSRLTDIEEEEEEEGGGKGGEKREKVYVAVGKSEEKTVSLLQWTFHNFRCCDICLVHVHHPSSFIPTPLGKLPATQANAVVVDAYRKEEREKVKKLLRAYLDFCYRAKVKASSIITEDDQIQKGLLNLVMKYGMQKLVMGSVPENCVKVKKNSRKASYAAKSAPAFCEIWFIHKGKHVWTREAFEKVIVSTTYQADEPRTDRLRSKSFQYKENDRLYNPVNLRSRSSHLSVRGSGVKDWKTTELTDEDLLLPCSGNPRHPGYARSSISNDSASSTSTEIRVSSDSGLNLEEENLYGQLLEAKARVETSRNEACLEFLKRKELEAEAMKTMRKVKEFESLQTHEAGLREEAEVALNILMDEQERLFEERLKVTEELQKTMRSVAVLDSRVQEANRRGNEAAEELKLIQVCVTSLWQEKKNIERQKMEAERWLENWRSRRRTGGSNLRGYRGLMDDVPELVEFSLSDLQSATCNFSDSFKLVEGGYGSIYKGELLSKTVAIQRFHAHNIQGPSQFQKQVQVLGKLRHPHLVTLIGVSPEAWSLVYDYVPNGCLQWRLFQKNNIAPLSWKIRARIISQISTSLLFLHTSHPEKIIHGDLKLESILLDSDLHCKIGDFGFSKLLSEDTPSFPSFHRYPEPQGAFPYRDPEFYRTGKLSTKSDIYSFGVIILQLLTGQPPVGLIANVRRAISGGKLDSILDSSAGNWGPFVAEKLADVALRFCEQNCRVRPDLTPSLVKELQQLHISKERPVPSFFLCPILQEIMCDPQVAADGFTYEGEAIREWLLNNRETSPMTNLRLDHLHLTPNNSLRLAAQEWLCKY